VKAGEDSAEGDGLHWQIDATHDFINKGSPACEPFYSLGTQYGAHDFLLMRKCIHFDAGRKRRSARACLRQLRMRDGIVIFRDHVLSVKARQDQ
jgi:hypothetical protein